MAAPAHDASARPTASVIVPTRDRPDYLEVALASIAAQAADAGAELIVVDDGNDERTRAVAARHGARYLSHDTPRGLNAARNSGIDAADSDLFVFVDDDVRARPGWLAAIVRGTIENGDASVFAGPIHAVIEDHPLRTCGREGPPITSLDLGYEDRPTDHAWGANMAVRREAVHRAGRFDERHELYGDEQEFQQRVIAAGGRVHYIAAAAVDHRRAGDDSRLRALCIAAMRRGGASRRYDASRSRAPSLARELLTLAGCCSHTLRFRCAGGIVMAAHSIGRLRAALARSGASAPSPATDAFLSGESGTVGGARGRIRAALDRALDAGLAVSGISTALGVAARREPPRRRVLVLGVERERNAETMARAVAELRHTRHELRIAIAPAGSGGKFENLNALLDATDHRRHDWLLVIDDDVVLPSGFLDRFLFLAERFGLVLAQPAHRLHSHAAWRVTRRRALSAVRETAFVEIGPVTAFRRECFDALLPFPDVGMGWGLDVHWAAVARQRGWPIGVVDLTPVGHLTAPAGDAYDRESAIAQARAFLAQRPYLPRAEAARTLRRHRTWARGRAPR